ncbi:hypothetical protein [Eggerthella sp. YY7918]|uniref:hypothetical protein n=1 Tax=Eggerthella sp. (strain YY7918) TaxID=502558 RepID=UPI00021716D1|nr:hypothetical protein [Eggerthella sp. YY7918]BAK45568.1 hypothetical protein EGYY_24990 [Eggerthella sp. YY7918]
MYISIADGTSEDGNVPEIAADNTALLQISVNTDGMDGSVCTVYVDGIETGQSTQERDRSRRSVFKAMRFPREPIPSNLWDGETPAIYKKAEYSVAG